MSESISNQHLAENEVIFREYNENIQKRFDELKAIAVSENQEDFLTSNDIPLHFYCECSDENCRKRILMEPKLYNEIHENRKRFIIIPDHVAADVEKVVDEQKTYWIVEKRFVPSIDQKDGLKGLNSTDVQNT